MLKNTARLGTAAAVIGAAALIAPAIANAAPAGSLGSAGEPTPPCTILSTENTPNGWGVPFEDEKGQEASYSADTVFDDDGALKLEVENSLDRNAWYHEASIPLSDVLDHEIGFAERAENPTAAFQLRLTGTTGNTRFENGFTTLVWEPAANDDVADTSEGGRHTDLRDGLWWSTSSIAGAEDRALVSLEAIVEANPDAVIDHYGISVGRGPAAASTLVDEVKFNGCTTNFAKLDKEPEATGSLGSLNFGSLFGSLNTGSLGSSSPAGGSSES